MILAEAADGAAIPGLPFGSALLLDAVPVTAAELSGADPDEAREASAARAGFAWQNRSVPL